MAVRTRSFFPWWLALVGCAPPPLAAPPAAVALPPLVVAEPSSTRPIVPRALAPSSFGTVQSCLPALRRGEGLGLPTGDPAGIEYARALEFEAAGSLPEARKAFFTVVDRYPRSPFVPLSYLAFGILFTRDARDDPSKWVFVEQSMGEVMKYPDPPGLLQMAAYLGAGAQRAQGNQEKTMALLQKAIDAGMSRATGPCAAAVTVAARHEMVFAFAKTGRPEAALAYFRRLFPSDDVQGPAGMVAELAELLMTEGRGPDAARVLEPLAGSPTQRVCEIARHVADAIAGGPEAARLARLRQACDGHGVPP